MRTYGSLSRRRDLTQLIPGGPALGDKLGGGSQLALWRRRLLGQPVAMVTFSGGDVDVARRLPRSWQARCSHLVVVPVDAFQGG
jgi:hypothetical protein